MQRMAVYSKSEFQYTMSFCTLCNVPQRILHFPTIPLHQRFDPQRNISTQRRRERSRPNFPPEIERWENTKTIQNRKDGGVCGKYHSWQVRELFCEPARLGKRSLIRSQPSPLLWNSKRTHRAWNQAPFSRRTTALRPWKSQVEQTVPATHRRVQTAMPKSERRGRNPENNRAGET